MTTPAARIMKPRWTGRAELWAHPGMQSFAMLAFDGRAFKLGRDWMHGGEIIRFFEKKNWENVGYLNRSHFRRKWIFMGYL